VIAVIDLDEAATKLTNAAETGDARALETLGWELLAECGIQSANLRTLRAACHTTSAWAAHPLRAELRAA
jgi:hypothetical protein